MRRHIRARLFPPREAPLTARPLDGLMLYALATAAGVLTVFSFSSEA
jgi:hypothetical protein